MELENKLEDLQEELDDQAFQSSPAVSAAPSEPLPAEESKEPGFMSESIYEKLPPSTPAKTRKPKPKSKTAQSPSHPHTDNSERKSMPILHEHYEPGTMLKEIPAHNDTITALDFDAPFGTLVTAALDDTVRVWDLSLGRCMGFLEGHTASVRCIQVEDNIVATGSMDASIRLWDLSRAQYTPMDARASRGSEAEEEDDGLGFGNEDEDAPPPPPPSSMEDCPLFTLEAHVAEVTALHFKNDTLVSGSADKTLRQWDLVKGRCVQTLDVLWAAAQATASNTLDSASTWRPTGSSRVPDSSADFVGAIQCFETALACGTADGMVRLWDLRSGQVHRSLVGHTGAVTCLQFDDVHLVTGSADRSIRVGFFSCLKIISFTDTDTTFRSGIFAPGPFTMPTPTMHQSPRCSSTHAASSAPPAKMSSRCTIRLMDATGIVERESRLRRKGGSWALGALSSASGSRRGLWSREDGMVALGFGLVRVVVIVVSIERPWLYYYRWRNTTKQRIEMNICGDRLSTFGLLDSGLMVALLHSLKACSKEPIIVLRSIEVEYCGTGVR